MAARRLLESRDFKTVAMGAELARQFKKDGQLLNSVGEGRQPAASFHYFVKHRFHGRKRRLAV